MRKITEIFEFALMHFLLLLTIGSGLTAAYMIYELLTW